MKSWQNIYEEVMTNHLRLSSMKHLRWNHDKAYTMKLWQSHEGEKLGEKTGEISPLHLNIIFTEFSNKIQIVKSQAWKI